MCLGQTFSELLALCLTGSEEVRLYISREEKKCKIKYMVARLPFVQKYNQYLLHRAFNEKPGEIIFLTMLI